MVIGIVKWIEYTWDTEEFELQSVTTRFQRSAFIQKKKKRKMNDLKNMPCGKQLVLIISLGRCQIISLHGSEEGAELMTLTSSSWNQ